MNSKKHIQARLDFLYWEREKIESTGFRINPDLKKTYKFIVKEIQDLQMCLFKDEYQQFSDHLMELFDRTPVFSSKENNNDLP